MSATIGRARNGLWAVSFQMRRLRPSRTCVQLFHIRHRSVRRPTRWSVHRSALRSRLRDVPHPRACTPKHAEGYVRCHCVGVDRAVFIEFLRAKDDSFLGPLRRRKRGSAPRRRRHLMCRPKSGRGCTRTAALPKRRSRSALIAACASPSPLDARRWNNNSSRAGVAFDLPVGKTAAERKWSSHHVQAGRRIHASYRRTYPGGRRHRAHDFTRRTSDDTKILGLSQANSEARSGDLQSDL